jgi:methylenetetrahydrofolate reductase (NADPH)
MLDEGRAYAAGLSPPARMRFGAVTGLRPLPAWKQAADFLFVQIGFSLEELLSWRSQLDLALPLYAGVLVVASVGMAHSLDIPGVTVPPRLAKKLERDRNAGVDLACDLVTGIRDSGAFDGVHLIPVARYREVAARLEKML